MTQLVVAIGGNALQPAGETADAAAQRRRIEATASRLTDLVAAGHDVVLTHGNGPQVGNILLQNEETRHLVPPMPLDVCGAESQALIGYLLEQALRNEFALRKIDREVACVVTQVLVHADDPAFTNPTKPIGPYYLRDDEILVKKAKGWKMAYDQRGGWRRIVPSPRRQRRGTPRDRGGWWRDPGDPQGWQACRRRGGDRQGPRGRRPGESDRVEAPRDRDGRAPDCVGFRRAE